MASLTDEVKFDVSLGYGPVKGSIKNSNTFKTSSKAMSSSDSFLMISSLKCKMYQLTFDAFELPPVTSNFASGLDSLRSAVNESSETRQTAFKKPRPTRGSLGSAFMSTTSTTRQQQSVLESSSTSVN